MATRLCIGQLIEVAETLWNSSVDWWPQAESDLSGAERREPTIMTIAVLILIIQAPVRICR